MAWVALALLALVVAVAVVLLVVSQGLLVLVMAGVSVAVVVVASAGWWAFTTRRTWKRRLNILVAGTVTVATALVVAVFSLSFAVAVASLAALTFAYTEAARRALAAPAAPGLAERPPPARPWLLVNLRSGGGRAARIGLVEAARRRGADVHELTPGEDAQALARAAVTAGADAVGVAGGDGSLAAVAAVAVQNGLPFICIPAGTRNHFAADLGLDRARPLAALGALHGRERRVDVGMVGARMFLNNVSLGAYSDLVHTSTYDPYGRGLSSVAAARAWTPECCR